MCPGAESRNLFNSHNRDEKRANVLQLYLHQIRPIANIHRPRTRSRRFALIVSEQHIYVFSFFRSSGKCLGFYQTSVMEPFSWKDFFERSLDKFLSQMFYGASNKSLNSSFLICLYYSIKNSIQSCIDLIFYSLVFYSFFIYSWTKK